MKKEKFAVVCLAAGQGRRMGSKVQKQYLMIEEKPVLYYALKAFQESPVEEIVLVVGAGEEDFCKKEIVEKYGFLKVTSVVTGGKERYHSVFQGIEAIQEADYVLIHDGARPFVTNEIIKTCMEGAKTYGACVAGMPVKDTVKVADAQSNIESTPERSRVWQIQTPQAFEFSMIKEAYGKLMEEEKQGKKPTIPVTDDAMVVEYFLKKKVHLVHGSYENIKLTTPEDMVIAQAFLSRTPKQS